MISPYLDKSLSIEKRIEDILGQMTLEEKVNEMHVRMASGDPPRRAALANNLSQKEAIDNSRLGIPLILARETSHGVNTADVTCFPVSICMASTWDTNLIKKVGAVIASEARSQGVHQGDSPVLDITRDPRWGRMEEGLGEDTFLACRLGVAFVKGLQGSTLDTDHNIIATAKHFAGYGAALGGKDNNPIEIPERVLEETYLPPFKAVIQEANLQSIMVCWGAVNGVPCTSNKKLVTDTLAKWNFDGFVIDDCPGTAGLMAHGVAANMKDAVCAAVNAGIDKQFCNFSDTPGGDTNEQKYGRLLLELVKEGKVPESRIDHAVRKVLRAKFRLGLFERPYVDPDRAEEIAQNPAHKVLAFDVAAKGVILLKNEGDLLPLKPDISSIAVIGPNADVAQLGDYSAVVENPISPLQGIQNNSSSDTTIYYSKGCGIKPCQRMLDTFSLRLSGNIQIDFEDEYQFYVLANKAVRLWIDDKNIIDSWDRNSLVENDTRVFLERGVHSIKIEYFNQGSILKSNDSEIMDPAILRLLWSSKTINKQIVPASAFSHAGQLGVQQDGIGEGLKMEVFLDTNIDDTLPEQSRVVDTIDFEWNRTSPIISEIHDPELDTDSIRKAAEVARKAEVAVVFVGEASSGPDQICGEHYDRSKIDLPGQQQALVQAIYDTGTPTIVVLINGRSLSINWIADNIPAVLEAWYPGEKGGEVIADILCGKINPSGKLPVSIPRSSGQLPVYYNHRPHIGWYIDSSSEPLFPFGFGLSYTSYEYNNLTVSPTKLTSDGTINVSVEVTNTGQREGDEIVQLYIADVISSVTTPVKQLKGFCRVALKKGQTKKVDFSLASEQLSLLNQELEPVVEPGEFLVMVGPNSTNLLKTSFWIQER